MFLLHSVSKQLVILNSSLYKSSNTLTLMLWGSVPMAAGGLAQEGTETMTEKKKGGLKLIFVDTVDKKD